MNVARIVSPRKPDHGCYKSQSRHLAVTIAIDHWQTSSKFFNCVDFSTYPQAEQTYYCD